MFLFVYIFLLMSVLGLFTNVYMLRTARMAENQTAVAESMMVWHGAAYKMAKANAASITPKCSLSQMLPPPLCSVYLKLTDVGGQYLPAGYNFSDTSYQFFSIVYTVSSVRYLLTYTTSAGTLGFTGQQILGQMKRAGFPALSYGGVSYNATCNGAIGNWLLTNQFDNGRQTCYPGMAVAGAPNGAVGIISVLGEN